LGPHSENNGVRIRERGPSGGVVLQVSGRHRTHKTIVRQEGAIDEGGLPEVQGIHRKEMGGHRTAGISYRGIQDKKSAPGK